MIVLSFFLVLVALGLLVAGLFGANQPLIWGSIVASVAAGLCLVAAVVQQRRVRPEGAHDFDFGYDERLDDESPTEITPVAGESARPDERRFEGHLPPPQGSWESEHVPETERRPDLGDLHVPHEERPAADHEDYYEDPEDEPTEEELPPAEVMQYVDAGQEVLVVDGRPRYHLDDCPHLRGRDPVGLPLSEAREAGFTPCSLCRPNSTLASRAH